MAGININNDSAWLVSGWAFRSVMEHLLADAYLPRASSVQSALASNVGWLDLEEWSARDFRLFTDAAKRLETDLALNRVADLDGSVASQLRPVVQDLRR